VIEVRIPVDAGLAQNLEDYFCEEYQQCWLLHEDMLTKKLELRGFFESEDERLAAMAVLLEKFPEVSRPPEILDLQDQDWKEAYKLHFKPWSERGLHWVPIWEKDNYLLPEGEQIVYLDPGMAFGTGNHETTRLCVRRLLDARDEWGADVSTKHVIDGGCGSGILAISAKKIGFTSIHGFDIDPDSVRISLENEKLCGIEGSIEFEWADLEVGLSGKTGDLLLVNILANILSDHAELLCKAVRPGGWLVLSGILEKEVRDVHAVFAPIVANISGQEPDMDSRTEGEWADLRYRF